MNEQARWANKTDQTERAPRDKITTFDTNKSTKNDKMILDLCTYKGLGVGYDKGIAQIKQFYMPHAAHQRRTSS